MEIFYVHCIIALFSLNSEIVQNSPSCGEKCIKHKGQEFRLPDNVDLKPFCQERIDRHLSSGKSFTSLDDDKFKALCPKPPPCVVHEELKRLFAKKIQDSIDVSSQCSTHLQSLRHTVNTAYVIRQVQLGANETISKVISREMRKKRVELDAYFDKLAESLVKRFDSTLANLTSLIDPPSLLLDLNQSLSTYRAELAVEMGRQMDEAQGKCECPQMPVGELAKKIVKDVVQFLQDEKDRADKQSGQESIEEVEKFSQLVIESEKRIVNFTKWTANRLQKRLDVQFKASHDTLEQSMSEVETEMDDRQRGDEETQVYLQQKLNESESRILRLEEELSSARNSLGAMREEFAATKTAIKENDKELFSAINKVLDLQINTSLALENDDAADDARSVLLQRVLHMQTNTSRAIELRDEGDVANLEKLEQHLEKIVEQLNQRDRLLEVRSGVSGPVVPGRQLVAIAATAHFFNMWGFFV